VYHQKSGLHIVSASPADDCRITCTYSLAQFLIHLLARYNTNIHCNKSRTLFHRIYLNLKLLYIIVTHLAVPVCARPGKHCMHKKYTTNHPHIILHFHDTFPRTPLSPEVHNYIEEEIPIPTNSLNPHHPTITTSSPAPFLTTPPSPQTSSISLKVYSTK